LNCTMLFGVTASFFSDPTHPNPLFSFQRSNVRHNQDGGQKKPFINRKNDF